MRSNANGNEIEQLLYWLAKLPGLGPRSAKRVALHLLNRRHDLMQPLAAALTAAAECVIHCRQCHALTSFELCEICADQRRDRRLICVVADIGDLWSIERTSSYRGLYHVLGGNLDALAGRGPEQLTIASLVKRLEQCHEDGTVIEEVILALSATVAGQTTAHYLMDCFTNKSVVISQLAHGLPMGGELEYLDDGTLTAAFKARKPYHY